MNAPGNQATRTEDLCLLCWFTNSGWIVVVQWCIVVRLDSGGQWWIVVGSGGQMWIVVGQCLDGGWIVVGYWCIVVGQWLDSAWIVLGQCLDSGWIRIVGPLDVLQIFDVLDLLSLMYIQEAHLLQNKLIGKRNTKKGCRVNIEPRIANLIETLSF